MKFSASGRFIASDTGFNWNRLTGVTFRITPVMENYRCNGGAKSASKFEEIWDKPSEQKKDKIRSL
jgi:hypothetical protein